MALIKCTECGKDVSDKAAACPNCGCPMEDIKLAVQRKEAAERAAKEEAERIRLKAEHDEQERKEKEERAKIREENKPKRKRAWIVTLCCIAALCVAMFLYSAISGKCIIHTWEEATCTAPRTCSVCGTTSGEALGHSWKDATCTEPKTCVRCKLTQGEPLGHVWVDATCTKPKTCSRCGETVGSSLGHDIHGNVCSRCNGYEDDLYIYGIDYTYSHGYYTFTGKVKNFTQYRQKFIKVRLTLYSNGNGVYTDWTYAVGDEGLGSGASTTFQIMCRAETLPDFDRYGFGVYD